MGARWQWNGRSRVAQGGEVSVSIGHSWSATEKSLLGNCILGPPPQKKIKRLHWPKVEKIFINIQTKKNYDIQYEPIEY